MDDPLSFMTPPHHAVRNFVVRELPRQGRPLGPGQIAQSLGIEVETLRSLLDDLEKHLFFLVRNSEGQVTWAFPVTTCRTPHKLRLSTGERIFGA